MRKALDVEVTQDDINNGIRLAADSCPVALAIKRKLPFARVVLVQYEWVTIGDDGYEVNDILYHWLKDYDAGAEMKPHTFRLKRLAPET